MTPKLKKLIQLSHKVREDVVNTKMYDAVTLAGGCGTASYHLMRCAKKNGISVRFVHGHFDVPKRWSHYHAWIEYQGHIIDLTRRQFDDYCGGKSQDVEVIPFSEETKYDLKKPGIRTPIIRDAWEWIKAWAFYPEVLKNNLIVL